MIFRYVAKTSAGEGTRGEIEAATRRDALGVLAHRGLHPSLLEPCGESGGGFLSASEREPVAQRTDLTDSVPRRSHGRIRRKDITALTRQLATLLEADVPVPAALDGLREEETNAALEAVLAELARGVRRGEALSEAMALYPKLFPALYVSMVEVGEEAGALDRVLSDLADLLEHEDEMRSEVIAAAAYPCFVLGFGIVTAFILLAFVMPRLFGMLAGMVDVLPLPTRILLAVSQFLESYWYVIIAGAVGVVFLVRWYLSTPPGRLAWDGWKLRLPVIGRVLRAAALVRFSRTLGTLVRSGVSLLPALRIVEGTTGNLALGRAIARVAEDTRGGESFATPLRKLGLFPPTMVQMISVGEDSGRLDAMLLRVASLQERAMRSFSRTLISLLGPVLILAVGALIGFLVISLLLPIFQMSQAVRG